MAQYRRFTNGQPAWWEADDHLDLNLYGPTVPNTHDNCRHRHYRLTCGQYERLLRRSQNHCEICGLPGPANAKGKLHIDHDPNWGQWAVRGLLCHDCNATERFPWMAVKAAPYHANAWYIQRLGELGIPLADPTEPPVRSEVADHRGLRWLRTGKGWVLQWGAWQPSPKSRRHLLYSFGPHNLTVVRDATA